MTRTPTSPAEPSGLLDRAGLERAVADIAEREGPGVPITLALIDIDHFKELNDDLGQEAGDAVLRGLEQLLTGSLPAGVRVARIGGDEYAAVFADTPAEGALILLEEVRQHFSAKPPAASAPRKADLSVGIATLPAHARDFQGLLRAADEALYRAKTEGRGRVAIYVESKMVLKSSYYPRAALDRLSRLSDALNRTEASLLREALDDLVVKYSDTL